MMNSEQLNQRMASGASWDEFCDALKQAGRVVQRDGSPNDPFDQAEGYRYLSRLTRVALESYIEFAQPLAPVLRRPAHETVKIGADNPDNYYQSAAISGQYEYRITGSRNTIHYLGMGTYAGNYGSKRRSGQTGYLEAADMEFAPDGSFEIAVSCQQQPGNWLPMEPDTSSLIVRQTYQDRAAEQTAELRIERVGALGPPPPLTPAALDEGLAAAAAYVEGTATLFAQWAEGFAQHKNELRLLDPAVAGAAHGDPNICYFHGYFELAADEALVVETMPPVCDYWNLQVNNHWMESLDYRYHRIALNHHDAILEPDGSVQIAIAHEDPGLPNWLETAGHARGTLCLRWIGAEQHPEPTSRVVKLADLKSA